MLLYLFIFFAIVGLANNAQTKRQQHLYFAISMTFLALFVGLSDMLGGYDRYIYGELFDDASDCLENGNPGDSYIIRLYIGEFGYYTWNFLVGIFTKNRYIFILLTTLLIYFLFWRGIKNQVENPMFSLIIFMALTFFFSFTYLRQMMAAAFAWQALPYVEKRDFKRFCLWTFIAFSFHNSSIDFFPVYFIPFKKFDIKYIDILMLICFVLGMSGISSSLFDSYSSIDASRANVETYAQESGFRVAYLVEAAFFYYFIRKYYNSLGNDGKSLLGLNISIVFCCILLVFVKSDNGGRLTWYYMIGLYILMTQIFTGRNRLAKPAFIVLVCFFLYFRILYAWGENGYQILYPYKTFLTPGARNPDRCHAEFEYDFNYDSDKFYR